MAAQIILSNGVHFKEESSTLPSNFTVLKPERSLPFVIEHFDHLVVHGRQHSKFQLTKGCFPRCNGDLNVVQESSKNSKILTNKKLDFDCSSFLWDINLSPQLEEFLNRSRQKEIENYIKISSEPSKALFQIGRSDDTYLDFHVTKPFDLKKAPFEYDYLPTTFYPNCREERDSTSSSIGSEEYFGNPSHAVAYINRAPTIDPISRYACRILMKATGLTVSTENICYHSEAKIFAGAIDSSNTIRLGDASKIWIREDGKKVQMYDGFTQNPLLVLKAEDGKPIIFGNSMQVKELNQVSVQGHIYKDTYLTNAKGIPVSTANTEENNLVDGSMIYFSGGSLLWRSSNGVAKGPTDEDLVNYAKQWNAKKYECPVLLKTLVIAENEDDRERFEAPENFESTSIPNSNKDSSNTTYESISSFENEGNILETSAGNVSPHSMYGLDLELEPNVQIFDQEEERKVEEACDYTLSFVYLRCGHVQGNHGWKVCREDVEESECPLCSQAGCVTTLKMGFEPAFWVDKLPPTHFFVPCGHMASEETVKYWNTVPIPKAHGGICKACPFCGKELEDVGYRKLFNPWSI